MGVYANGHGLHRGSDHYCVCPHTAVLQVQPHLHIPILATTFWHEYLQVGCMALLCEQDVGRECASVCGRRGIATISVWTIGYSILGERYLHGDDRLSLYLQGRCKVAHLDGLAQDLLPYPVCGAVYLLCAARRGEHRGLDGQPYDPYILL